jgi:hypothetical protein
MNCKQDLDARYDNVTSPEFEHGLVGYSLLKNKTVS